MHAAFEVSLNREAATPERKICIGFWSLLANYFVAIFVRNAASNLYIV